MTSKYIWHYFLAIPAAQVPAADEVAPALNNPDGVEATFQPYPEDNEEPTTHWIATFVATDYAVDGVPSKQLLEGALNDNPDLANILWIRSRNPHHPATTEAEKNIVVASNWEAFLVGSGVDWDAVIHALP